jgi:hypothetical protein
MAHDAALLEFRQNKTRVRRPGFLFDGIRHFSALHLSAWRAQFW